MKFFRPSEFSVPAMLLIAATQFGGCVPVEIPVEPADPENPFYPDNYVATSQANESLTGIWMLVDSFAGYESGYKPSFEGKRRQLVLIKDTDVAGSLQMITCDPAAPAAIELMRNGSQVTYIDGFHGGNFSLNVTDSAHLTGAGTYSAGSALTKHVVNLIKVAPLADAQNVTLTSRPALGSVDYAIDATGTNSGQQVVESGSKLVACIAQTESTTIYNKGTPSESRVQQADSWVLNSDQTFFRLSNESFEFVWDPLHAGWLFLAGSDADVDFSGTGTMSIRLSSDYSSASYGTARADVTIDL